MSEKRKNVTLLEFVRAYQTSGSIAEVMEKTGLSNQSVTTKALKYRKAEYKQAQKVDGNGKTLWLTPAGAETTDKTLAKTAKVGTKSKAVPVMVDVLDAEGKRIVTREAINLKNFPRTGGVRLDAAAANALIEQLMKGEETESEGEETESETEVEANTEVTT